MAASQPGAGSVHGDRRPRCRLRSRVPSLLEVAEEFPIEAQVVGVTRGALPAPDWPKRLDVPGSTSVYPRFVRWLRHECPFDVGSAP